MQGTSHSLLTLDVNGGRVMRHPIEFGFRDGHARISSARLILQRHDGDGPVIPAYFNSTTAEQHSGLEAPDSNRAVIVLNACQAGWLGFKLTGIGGFAQAFLQRGTGAFVGTLWSVFDQPARTFVETFYSELLTEASLAEATIKAREEARKAGDATWLAYAVYGHPHARVIMQ